MGLFYHWPLQEWAAVSLDDNIKVGMKEFSLLQTASSFA
jgi:hypothetical protein